MIKKKILSNAQKSGSIVKVVYESGSQPCHAREIIPLKIENNKVFATCLNSNATKMFYIKRLKLINNRQYSRLRKWDPNFIPLTDYEIYDIQKKKRYKKAYRYLILLTSIILLIISFILMYSLINK